jgi:hypothetical protein
MMPDLSAAVASPSAEDVRARNQILRERGELHYLPAERLFLLARLRHAISSDQGIGLAQHMATSFALTSAVALPLAYRFAPRLGTAGCALACMLPVVAFVGSYIERTYQQYETFVNSIALQPVESSTSLPSSPSSGSFPDCTSSSLASATALPSSHAAALLHAAHSLLSAEREANLRRASASLSLQSLFDRAAITSDGSHLGEFPLTRHKRAMVEDAMRRAGLRPPQY